MPSQACAVDELGRRHREDLVGRAGDDVRDQHLLGEADDEAAHAVGEVVDRHDAARELIGDVAVADDRSGDQLRKQQQVERRVHRALLRGRVAPRDVDDVRDRVEGEERDADRQQHARDRRSAGRAPQPSSALTLSAKKLAYLKMPSTTRLTVTANASRRAAPRPGRADGPDRPRSPSSS